MEWTEEELAMIDQIEAIEAQEEAQKSKSEPFLASPAPRPQPIPSNQPVDFNPFQESQNEARQIGSDVMGYLGNIYKNELAPAGRRLGEFIAGPDVPVPVQLGSLTDPVRRKSASGQDIQRYSDGKWYPVGTTFKKPSPRNGETFQLNGHTYVVQADGTAKLVKGDK